MEINDETAGMSAGDAAAVEGRSQAYFPEREFVSPANMHGMCFATVFRCLAGDFCRGDDQGVALFGQFIGAAQVIAVSMGNKNIIYLQVFHGNVDGVAIDKRIANKRLAAGCNGKAGMVDKFEFCRHDNSSFLFFMTS